MSQLISIRVQTPSMGSDRFLWTFPNFIGHGLDRDNKSMCAPVLIIEKGSRSNLFKYPVNLLTTLSRTEASLFINRDITSDRTKTDCLEYMLMVFLV